MLFDQLIRLVGRLGEIVFAVFLAAVFVVGLLFLLGGIERGGLLIMLGVAWFVIGALKNRC